MTNNAIEFEGVSFSYDENLALCDVSFAVSVGERVGLLGANGCGKSTLLRIIDALLFASNGTYLAFGRDVTEKSMRKITMMRWFRSHFGFVFQDSSSQVFSSTVKQDIEFGCEQLGLSKDEMNARVSDVLKMLDIEELADRAPTTLSSGQLKRVAIAGVLVMNPDVLLYDEPTAGLDPRMQRWIIDFNLQMSQLGKTLVIATHDLHLLPQLVDRVLVFSGEGENAHQLVRDDSVGAVLRDEPFLRAHNLL